MPNKPNKEKNEKIEKEGLPRPFCCLRLLPEAFLEAGTMQLQAKRTDRRRRR